MCLIILGLKPNSTKVMRINKIEQPHGIMCKDFIPINSASKLRSHYSWNHITYFFLSLFLSFCICFNAVNDIWLHTKIQQSAVLLATHNLYYFNGLNRKELQHQRVVTCPLFLAHFHVYLHFNLVNLIIT